MVENSWNYAVKLLARFLGKPARLEHLIERLPASLEEGVRRRCQSLLFGSVRHIRFLEACLDDLLKRRPRVEVWAALLVSAWEMMERPELRAKIVHHAVERIGIQHSRGEKAMANAVLRKIPARISARLAVEPSAAAELSVRFSHPEWLVARWAAQFGLEATRKLLEWNQSDPQIYARWQNDAEDTAALEWLRKVGDGYFAVEKAGWEACLRLTSEGKLYLQNPGAGRAPQAIVDRFESGRVLDLCSAPGGKALYLECALGSGCSEIVSVDLPGRRFERLQENIERYRAERIRLLASDAQTLDTQGIGKFEAVLLDAPCSNSGVLQRKIDARWRIKEAGLPPLLELQLSLLKKASEFVAENGLLVYSTCSIDRDENEGIVRRFQGSLEGSAFEQVFGKTYLPWQENHDGAGVFVLRKRR